jgi:hypothetical protein
MLNTLFIVLATLVVVGIAARWYGAYRWTARTQRLRAALDAARAPVRPLVVDFRELDGLPPPVQRFFRAVLKEGQPLVAGVRLQHAGLFNMGETTDQWKAFTSDQQVVPQRPGFDWDGRIAMLPGLPVRVHDAYVAGDGILHASLLGLYAVADLRGGGDMAQGELMRFFAEMTWYPTALLPSQGVRWGSVDDRSASATLTDEQNSVALRFTFHADGPIDTVHAAARARMVGGTLVQTPWQGRFWNYQERAGMRVPLDGEVAWLLPEGAKPYWRGRITDITFEFAR